MENRITATVDWIDSESGYGLLKDENNRTYFMHYLYFSAKDVIKSLNIGDAVSFKPELKGETYHAINAKIVDKPHIRDIKKETV